MGVEFLSMKSYYEYGKDSGHTDHPKQVLDLACKVLEPIIKGNQINASHLVVATTCPDRLAPSLGQELNSYFYPVFKDSHVIDIVQGCAGGITALLLGNKLAENNHQSVVVVIADAARKACDKNDKDYNVFGNGAFACVLASGNSTKGLLHYKSRQYQELTEVVNIKLGQDIGEVLTVHKDTYLNPGKYLGLQMKKDLAISLMIKAKGFYDEFISEINIEPDILILHQVNPKIIAYLGNVFKKKGLRFINVSEMAGNCGTASIGVALKHEEESLLNKKVGICSFGTGGVITAGLWQF